jgi:hypothetical protein
MKQRLKPQLLPPLVIPPETSDRRYAFVERIIQLTSPDVVPGHRSTMSDQEIEECITVTAIALCWHFSSLRDLVKRDKLLKTFPVYTFGLMSATEAARDATKNGTTITEELRKMSRQLGVAEEGLNCSERSEFAGAVFKPDGNDDGYPRRLPRLGIPVWASTNSQKLVVHLFDEIDSDTKPGFVSSISEREIVERAGACHIAMCWYLGALRTSNKSDQIALRWVEEVPTLVRAMAADPNSFLAT